MKRSIAVCAAVAWACLWLAVFAAAQVPFAVVKRDIETYWKKNWSKDAILEINAAGAGISSVKIVNLKKVPYYSVPARVRVKRADGSVANFSVSAIYRKPGATWIFEDVATGNVTQEKASGQEPLPFAEAEAMITKGWMEKYTAEGNTEITIHKVHPNPTFKSSGQWFGYYYRVDVDFRSYNTRYQCKGQEAGLTKKNAGAAWEFWARWDASRCQGQAAK